MGKGCIKLQRIGWKGATTASFLCCKNFEPDCFVTEGVGTAMLLESLQRNGSKLIPYPQYFRNPLMVTVNQLRHPKDLHASERRKHSIKFFISSMSWQQTDSLCIDIARLTATTLAPMPISHIQLQPSYNIHKQAYQSVFPTRSMYRALISGETVKG